MVRTISGLSIILAVVGTIKGSELLSTRSHKDKVFWAQAQQQGRPPPGELSLSDRMAAAEERKEALTLQKQQQRRYAQMTREQRFTNSSAAGESHFVSGDLSTMYGHV